MGILDEAIREHLELKRQHGAEGDELKRLEDEAFGPPTRPGEPDFPEAEIAEQGTGELAQAEAATTVAPQPGDGVTEALAPVSEPPQAPAEAPAPPEPEDSAPAEAPEAEESATEHAIVGDENGTSFYDQTADDEFDLGDVDLSLEDEAPPPEPAAETPPAPEPPASPPAPDLEPPPPEPESTPPPSAAAEPPIESLPTVEHPLEPASEEYQVAEPASEEYQVAEPGSEEYETEPPSEEHDVAEAPSEEHPAAEPDSEEHETAGEPESSEEDEEDVLADTPEFLRDAPEDDELWFEQGEPKDFDFD